MVLLARALRGIRHLESSKAANRNGSIRGSGCKENEIVTRKTKSKLDQYEFSVRPLSRRVGGGYIVEYPDLPGCMSDGETIEEAIANGREALRDTLDVITESGRKISKPGKETAQWRQRLPRALYSKLTAQAQTEGTSINSLVSAIIAEAIGAKQAR